MKKHLITALLLVVSASLSAQDKKMDKIAELYNKQDFENCIVNAKKYNSSNSSNPKGFYYVGLSQFGQYLASGKEPQLKIAQRSIFTAVGKDREKQFFNEFSSQMNQLKDTLTSYQTRYYNNGDKNTAKDYGEMIAKIYGDTTEIFLRLIHPEYFEAPKVVGKSLAFYNGPTNQTDIAGKKQGVWVEKYRNGNRKTQINYVDGKPLGDYYRFHERTGGLSAHLYFSDYNDASAILYDEEGSIIAMGYYHNQKKDSIWQYLKNDTIVVSQEIYKNGVKDGKQTTYYDYGFPAEEIMYVNGVREGTWKRYYETMQPVFETTYHNDKLEGKYTKYDVDGNTIMSGNYKNGLPVGEWTVYDEDTKKFKKVKYVDGKPENYEQLEDAEAKKLEQMMQQAKEIADPQDYINNPEDYPIDKR